jgi:hypothetical protein
MFNKPVEEIKGPSSLERPASLSVKCFSAVSITFIFFFYILGSLSIYPVELGDDGDYVCIASNTLGRSFSSVRSLIVSGKNKWENKDNIA